MANITHTGGSKCVGNLQLLTFMGRSDWS